MSRSEFTQTKLTEYDEVRIVANLNIKQEVGKHIDTLVQIFNAAPSSTRNTARLPQFYLLSTYAPTCLLDSSGTPRQL